MSAVVSAIGDAIGGVVEAVGDAVEAVGDVVGDIGKAIDDYVIQPILDDPLTAIATVAGAAILGPMIAPSLGVFGAGAGAVGAGLGAAAGNTTAGLVQGEDFDEALKGGVISGITAGITQGAFDYFGGPSVPGGSAAVPDEALASAADDPLGQFLAKNNNFADVDVGLPGGTGATTYAVPPPPSLTPTALNPLDETLATTLDDVAVPPARVSTPSTSSPLNTVAAEAAPRNYLTEGLDDSFGKLKVPKIDPNAPLPRTLTGDIDFSLGAGMQSTGPGLQLPKYPSLSSMGGGSGLTVDVAAVPDFTYSMNSLDPSIRGMSDSWVGESGKLYGAGTPAGKVGELGFVPTPDVIPYAPQGPAAARTLGDKLKSFDLADINASDLSGVAGKVLDYAIENPLTTLAGITLVGGALTQSPPPNAQPQPGKTRDPNFTRPMDIYNYYRDQQNYGDDIYRYAQTGGEHQFFTPSRFELVTPPPVNTAANGGLMKFANGGQMPMSAMGPLQQAMQTGNMPPAGGQGRGLPSGPMQGMPQGRAQPQGMQGMPQGRAQPTNRNRKTAYYQYGTPPAKMAMGGALNMVRSYNVGGGADGRSDDVNAVLSDGEYVFDAETVALLGNGSSEAGADRLDQMREQIRKQKGQSLAKGKISPDARSPLSYLKRS
jgi:hypothetical protein